MHEFVCPHCSIPLRVRDESFRNRTIECPDCGRKVLIQETAHGLAGVAAATGPSLPPRQESRVLQRSARRTFLTVWIVVVVGLLISGLLSISLLHRTDPPEPVSGSLPFSEQAVETVPAPAVESPLDSPATMPVEVEVAPPAPTDPVQARLLAISRMLADHVREYQTYPLQQAGKDNVERSWISRLAEWQLPAVHAQWTHNWNARANDEFVRRRFSAFENPLVSQKSGDDNYPATHFVGISGVGVDAAELPRHHPRAGIFSSQRQTTPADVTDGLSNTLLLAGVESKLGSWARPGSATIRSFTREPYLHGPDGFGTGQADSMLVLMADGNVKTLSTKTDPLVIRRMAAMADGLALDAAAEAGDPVTMQARLPADKFPGGAIASVSDAPILVELAPEPLESELSVPDMTSRLEQKIALFEQVKPAPLRNILFDLQELAGVPVDASLLKEEVLQRSVSVTLRNTTVGEIFQQVGRSAGVSCIVRQSDIQFTMIPKLQ